MTHLHLVPDPEPPATEAVDGSGSALSLLVDMLVDSVDAFDAHLDALLAGESA